MASTPIKIKRIPRPTHKAKTLTRLTSRILGGTGVTVTRSGLDYTIASSAVTVPDTPVVNNSIARFDGVTGSILDDSSATISDDGTVDINPTALSVNQGFNVSQTSPTSGTATGPLSFNEISVNNQYGTTGSSDTYGLATHHAAALRVELTEGGNVTGFQSAIYARLNHTISESTIVSADHVTGIFVAVSDKDANGKGLYALNGLAWAKSGSDHGHVTASELEAGVFTGATVNHKTGVRLHSWGEEHGALSDTAIAVVSQTGSSFNTFALFGQFGEAQCIDATGQFFKADQAFTVDSIFDLDNVTVTTNILNFPHVVLTGAGLLTLNQNSAAVITPPTGTRWHFVSSSHAAMTLDAFGTGVDTILHFRTARGTLASPTATQSGDLIGGITGNGYGATGMSTSRVAVLGFAAENWTDAAQGAYLDLFTTPTGSVTKAVAVRVHNNKGVSIGNTADPGASSLHVSSNIVANGYLATGGVGVGTGEVRIGGNTSGTVKLTAQAAAGTPTVTFGTGSGTPAVTASAPLAINTTTGDIGFDAVAWTTFTPTMSWGGGGTPSAFTASGAYKIMGKSVMVKLRLILTTANGVTTSFTFGDLPFTLLTPEQVINGVEYQINGLMMRGISATATSIQCKRYDNTWAAPVNNERYIFNGVMELA